MGDLSNIVYPEDLQTYMNQFNLTVNKTPIFSNIQLVMLNAAGLHPVLQIDIQRHEPHALESATALALKFQVLFLTPAKNQFLDLYDQKIQISFHTMVKIMTVKQKRFNCQLTRENF